ncbi:MAG TPA: diaminopimelate epimerase [Chthoniobacteraceae bacterium]|nr:diaminopimelate epimerase [Chthoniobacteraceae bacterium]
MNGAGNDFVLMDNRSGDLRLDAKTIERICDRHRGVGADGLLLVEPAANGADFRMRYYNSDGGEAEMCGNGARCFARYATRLAGARERVSFETPAGVITADFSGELVRINMSTPRDLRLNETLDVLGAQTEVNSVNTGVPHAVVFVDDLETVDVSRVGSAIRYHAHFAPKGTNVSFVKRLDSNTIAIRTYERGVEGETLACGTGVVACALILHELHGVQPPIGVRVKGGDLLQVGFDKTAAGYGNVTLTGPADFVFDGKIEI